MPLSVLMPPSYLPPDASFESCWDGPMSLVPLARMALGVMVATVVFARMWFTPGPVPRHDRLREIGLFAAAGLAWGLAWVAVPVLPFGLSIWWAGLSGGAEGRFEPILLVLLLVVPVASLMLTALLLRMKPMEAHLATIRQRQASLQNLAFIL